jgi:hypothetical protein
MCDTYNKQRNEPADIRKYPLCAGGKSFANIRTCYPCKKRTGPDFVGDFSMSRAALSVYEAIRHDGSQKNALSLMQTRAELYDFLDYHAYEQKLDTIFLKEEKQ